MKKYTLDQLRGAWGAGFGMGLKRKDESLKIETQPNSFVDPIFKKRWAEICYAVDPENPEDVAKYINGIAKEAIEYNMETYGHPIPFARDFKELVYKIKEFMIIDEEFKEYVKESEIKRLFAD